MKKTQAQKSKQGERSRDFFCVVRDAFRVFAHNCSTILGSAWAFTIAVLIIIIWGATGPAFHFSNTWQLIINTGTTIVTFLMVFLIQNTQNRDAMAMHLKLDELIRSIETADNAVIRAEDETDEELALLKQKYEALCDEHEELKARLTSPGENGKAERVVLASSDS